MDWKACQRIRYRRSLELFMKLLLLLVSQSGSMFVGYYYMSLVESDVSPSNYKNISIASLKPYRRSVFLGCCKQYLRWNIVTTNRTHRITKWIKHNRVIKAMCRSQYKDQWTVRVWTGDSSLEPQPTAGYSLTLPFGPNQNIPVGI